MPPIDWQTAIQYARLIEAAEAIPPAGDDDQLKTKIDALNYTYLQTLWANELATDIDPHAGQIVSFGFLAASKSGSGLLAAIRGTDTIWEWIHDASFLMVPSPIRGASGTTEDGFTVVYRSLRIAKDPASAKAAEAINNLLDAGTGKTVTICGHSLGGALATLLALDVALNTACKTPDVYTYASPRVGDHAFAGSFNASLTSSYRIVNRQDLVPQLPPILPLPYEHVKTEYELTPVKDTIKLTIPCMHHLTTYLWLMGRAAHDPSLTLDPACVETGFPET